MDFEWINGFVIFVEYVVFVALSILLLIRLNNMDQDLIGARIFLKKHTLSKNFYSMGVAGGFLVFHEFMNMGITNGVMPYSYDILSESLKTMSLVFLIIWMYTWHNVLNN